MLAEQIAEVMKDSLTWIFLESLVSNYSDVDLKKAKKELAKEIAERLVIDEEKFIKVYNKLIDEGTYQQLIINDEWFAHAIAKSGIIKIRNKKLKNHGNTEHNKE